MAFINFNTRKKVKIWDGIYGALHHSGKITCGHISLDPGIVLPEHHHIQEQWTHIIEGEMEFRVGNETMILKPGMCAFVPPDVPHAGRALTACKAIDIFQPVREDFIALERQQLGS